MKRFPAEVLAAVVAGFGAGLLYAWQIAPIRYVDTTPNTLRADFKEQFRTAISAAYAATGNLDRARARLDLLGDPDPIDELTAQAQRMLAGGESFQAAQELAQLASDLQAGSSSVALPTSSQAPPTLFAVAPPTVSPTGAMPSAFPDQAQTAPLGTPSPTLDLDTPTARPTRTPIPTASAPFQLVSQDRVCNPGLTDGLLQITVLDNNGHPMPGVELALTWNAGEERFFTGFKPEISDGYADYVMQAGVAYSLQVAGAGTPMAGLIAPTCTDSANQTYMGGLKLSFRQP